MCLDWVHRGVEAAQEESLGSRERVAKSKVLGFAAIDAGQSDPMFGDGKEPKTTPALQVRGLRFGARHLQPLLEMYDYGGDQVYGDEKVPSWAGKLKICFPFGLDGSVAWRKYIFFIFL